MINISDITQAVVEQINNYPAIRAKDFNVSRSSYVNYDPDLTPWVGVYKGTATYTPRTMGRHARSWTFVAEINIVVQASHFGTGAEAEDRLDEYLQIINDALWADPTIGDTVSMITSLGIDYTYEYTESETTHFQWAVLKLTVEAQTG